MANRFLLFQFLPTNSSYDYLINAKMLIMTAFSKQFELIYIRSKLAPTIMIEWRNIWYFIIYY